MLMDFGKRLYKVRKNYNAKKFTQDVDFIFEEQEVAVRASQAQTGPHIIIIGGDNIGNVNVGDAGGDINQDV